MHNQFLSTNSYLWDSEGTWALEVWDRGLTFFDDIEHNVKKNTDCKKKLRIHKFSELGFALFNIEKIPWYVQDFQKKSRYCQGIRLIPHS